MRTHVRQQKQLMMIGVVEGYTYLLAHTNGGHCSDQDIYNTRLPGAVPQPVF